MLDIMCSKSYKNLNQYLGSLEKKIPRYPLESSIDSV